MCGMRLHLRKGVKGIIFILNPKFYELELLREFDCLTRYQSLVWQEILGLNHLFIIYSRFVDLKINGGLDLVYLTLHVRYETVHEGGY